MVGEAPSRTSDPISPLIGGRSGSFLCRLAGLRPHQAAFLFRFVNLLPEWPALHAKRRLVRAAGLRLRPTLLGRRVVVLGRLVAGALGLDGDFGEWYDQGSMTYCITPHPSGLSRVWAPTMRASVSAVLRAEAARAAEGALLDLPSDARLPWLETVACGQSSG